MPPLAPQDMRFLICTILGFASIAALISLVVTVIPDLPRVIETTGNMGLGLDVVLLWAHLILGPIGFAWLAHACLFEGNRLVSKERARAFDQAFAAVLGVAIVGIYFTFGQRYPSGSVGAWLRVGLWLCNGFLVMWTWRRLWRVRDPARDVAGPPATD